MGLVEDLVEQVDESGIEKPNIATLGKVLVVEVEIVLHTANLERPKKRRLTLKPN